MKGRFARSVLCLLGCMMTFAALAQAAPDMLGVAGPLRFGEQRFALAWSSHPSPLYYKHEYLPAGETVERYNAMLMLDLLATPKATPADVAMVQVESLKQRKATDPLVNYDLLVGERGDGVILDFVLSAADADGAMIVEWNAYRYVPNPAGQGTLLIAISRRGYGDDGARAFLQQLKATRQRDIALLAKMPVPALAPVAAD
jgi:hypothetical protein